MENRDRTDSRKDSHPLLALSAPETLRREPLRSPPPSLLTVLNPYVVTALVNESDVECA